ncbi:UbiA prenyltransferase family-domain-containing protein [Aspergillus multicolor]|uniref:UbiA prenyltransferase family-domain-containing protein n=1 Tax=Aspergillus multicolor TaxID=41759 RepID=UPI003CCD7840
MPHPPASDNRYRGNSRTGWLQYVPESTIPFIKLARLSPPVGLLLVYLPHAFGLLLGAILTKHPADEELRAGAVLLVGSFFGSNVIHIWNDLVDAPLDALVERTKHRPIPRGAISRSVALGSAANQALAALLFLVFLPGGLVRAVLYALPSAAMWAYYPYAKRHIDYPQLVLGLCLAWGVVVGCLAVNVSILHFTQTQTLDSTIDRMRLEPSILCLFTESTL